MWFKRMKLSVCLVVCQSLSVELQQKSSGSTKEILSLVKCPMLELFSCAVFSEGHLAGNLRSPSARQAYKAIKIGSPSGALQPGRLHPASRTSGFEVFIYLWEKIQMHGVE